MFFEVTEDAEKAVNMAETDKKPVEVKRPTLTIVK